MRAIGQPGLPLLATALLIVLASCTTLVRQDDLAGEYYNLGNAFFQLERYQEAADYYQKALTLNPELSTANYNLARSYLQVGRTADAVAILQRLLTDDPSNLLLKETLGYARYLEGNSEEALSLFLSVIEASPYRTRALFNAALIYIDRGRFATALPLLERAHNAAPSDSEVKLYLGIALLEAGGDPERALRTIDEAQSDMDPLSARELSLLGAAYADSRYYKRALDTFDELLQAEPNNPEALFTEAVILLTEADEGEKGVAMLRRALNAGFSDEGRITRLLDNPGLVNEDAVRSLLKELRFGTEEAASGNNGAPQDGDAGQTGREPAESTPAP